MPAVRYKYIPKMRSLCPCAGSRAGMLCGPAIFNKRIVMQIEPYTEKYDNEIISLILSIQNDENKLGLSLGEQPGLLDIKRCYRLSGGGFRVALSDDKVIGTIGLMLKARQCAVLKKIFVQKKFCSQGVGLALYNTLLTYAKGADIRHIIPPPSVARVSHRFYERAGFYKIAKNQLPISYIYPGRDSILY